MVTPVPISNTEVKHFSADDSVSENKTLPVFLCNKKGLTHVGPFTIHLMKNNIKIT